MTTDDNGGLSERRPIRSGYAVAALPCARHTLWLVINLSAKVMEAGRYGPVREMTHWHGARAKSALTCTNRDSVGRVGTAEGGVQVPLQHQICAEFPASEPEWSWSMVPGGLQHLEIGEAILDSLVHRPVLSLRVHGEQEQSMV